MTFGQNGVIKYNTKSGGITVTEHGKKIFSGTIATARLNGKTFSAADYQQPTFTTANFSDALGKGTKYSLTFKQKELPILIQTFYTYPELPFFITQLEIKGQSIATNYLAPLISAKIQFANATQLQTVFIPYDNDAFISYDSKAVAAIENNRSAEVGLLFDNDSREGLVIGSLEHTVWKTAVETTHSKDSVTISAWAGYTEKNVTRDEIPHGLVKGNNVLSPKMFIGHFADWRIGMETYAKTNRSIEKPFVFNWDKPTPVGWNSWGVLQEKINYENTTAVADFFADAIPQFRIGKTAYIDLDSFWDNMVQGGFTGDFSKVKAFADYCRQKGLEPGAYWAPFTDWGDKNNPARIAEGTEFTFGEMWTKVGNGYFDFDGARAIDPTHPGTLKRIDYVIGKLKACGFKMIKIDFLGHAAAESTAFSDSTITTGMQAYRVGMEHLVKALDGQMLIYGAISPSLATSRYVHTRRIACDAWKTIADTQYTLNSLNYGWWQTYTYNYIDADHVVFAEEKEGANRARLMSAVITGTLITGDNYSINGPWSERAKELLQNKELLKIVENGVAFQPIEGNTGTKTSETFVRKIGDVWYLAVFNYGKSPKEYHLPIERMGLPLRSEYKLLDIFSNKEAVFKGNAIDLMLPAEDARIFKIVKP